MSDQKRNSASYLHPPPVLGKEYPQPHELPRGLEVAFADGLSLVWGTWLGNPSPRFPHPDSFTTGCFATDKLLYPLLLLDFKWRIQFPVSDAQQGTLALEASKGKKKQKIWTSTEKKPDSLLEFGSETRRFQPVPIWALHQQSTLRKGCPS